MLIKTGTTSSHKQSLRHLTATIFNDVAAFFASGAPKLSSAVSAAIFYLISATTASYHIKKNGAG